MPVIIGFAVLRHFRARLLQYQFQLARLFRHIVRPVEKQIDDIDAKFVNIIPAEAIRYRIRTGGTKRCSST